MGSFMGYKNVETLVSAMAQLPGYELRLLSKITDARREELRILAGSAANRVVFLGGVSDAQYQSELDNAFALVSASLDEGFGIPVVEAMERATPVVISDIEIFKEIGGDAAKYFDAKDIKQLVRAIESLESKAEYSRASAASLKRANDFSWKQSAAALVATLEKL
jgi:glycosyltransferase involved in cell wall biosynthesis